MDADFFKLVTQQTGALAVALIAMYWLRTDGLRRIEEMRQREADRVEQAEERGRFAAALAAREREDKLRMADVLDRNTSAITALTAAVQQMEVESAQRARARREKPAGNTNGRSV